MLLVRAWESSNRLWSVYHQFLAFEGSPILDGNERNEHIQLTLPYLNASKPIKSIVARNLGHHHDQLGDFETAV
jgi:hypothetical protein